ncbi:hypothetical protein Poli38472_000917 [Pythium oligandrum]|uniref:Exocyst complex component Sec8 n=1 Tax=Pythium oligandrum TaxID=41045 RepID=A0A8K1CDN2_PYTOL|nr:hypothetical protein Poli38472_000917 [Pythium oligandrum]|eukprot:TMW60875.1 hypothetical protein Poli38472_000917 [Pythium oligandrum]
MQGIDATFFDKKFNVSRYMLRYVVGASNDEIRQEQLQRVAKFRAIADAEIAGVIDQNYTNFNTSLARFTVISNQLQDTREKIREVSKRATDGKNILSSKTKNLRELLLQKYEAKKVIDIINDIQYIEAAPSKIHVMMSERNFTGAVDMFTKSLDLVFSEKLVAFHAITGVRNTLMECKQSIEDNLVQELHHTIYMKGAFANFSKANQYSMAAIEHELSSDSFLDNEFDKIMFQSNQRDNDSSENAFAESNVALRGTNTFNALESAVKAVKKIHREMEVIGSLKSSLENELNEVVIEISLICRGIFNAGSYTSFENHFTEKKFGKHDHSTNFQTFLRLLFHVLRRIAQRHYLVAAYFNSNGDSYNYGMPDILHRITSLLERVLSDYLEELTATEANAATKDTDFSITSGDLFKLSRNKQPDDSSGMRLMLPHDYHGKVIEETRTRVCEASVFHLPVVYDDLQQISRDLQQFATASSASSSATTVFSSFLNMFIAMKWIPKVKAKAQQFLSMKYRGTGSSSTACRLPIPSDTSYQPPSIESLLFIAGELREMIIKMPDHLTELIGVLDATVLKWLDECAIIAKDIREPTLNHRQIIQSVSFSELLAAFHKYDRYQKAKRNAPIPFQHSKVAPVNAGKTAANTGVKPASEIIRQKEYELEKESYDPDAWSSTKGLLMDNSRIAMMAYINSACDYIAEFLQTVTTRGPRATGSFSQAPPPSSTLLGNSTSSAALQATSWKCSALADECLLFLRREIRLHCFYFLTQLASQRYDLKEDQATMAQDSVLCLNINLSAIEHALRPYLSSDKMALVFDGIDALLANILISNLQQMQGATMTKGGVQQMLLNIGALHQGLTGILYSYPTVGRAGYHFEYAKRYYQLLLLSETQLELFLLDNRKAYTPDAFKSLWRVETPHRVLGKGSQNKLDSLLR